MEITDELVSKITDELWRRLEPEASPAVGRPAQDAPVSGRLQGRRRVLTEAEVRAACPAAGGPGQTLVLAPGDFLTPLALDYVRSMSIKLIVGEAEG
jgi:hypothetical protein